jgi:hypothetical protein
VSARTYLIVGQGWYLLTLIEYSADVKFTGVKSHVVQDLRVQASYVMGIELGAN